MSHEQWDNILKQMKRLRLFHYILWTMFNISIFVSFMFVLLFNPIDCIVGIFCTLWAIVMHKSIIDDNRRINNWVKQEPQ